MFDNIFGIHEQALLLHGQRLSVLANNLANADTPGFKARDIDFAAVLGGASSESGGAAGEQAPLPVTITHGDHIVTADPSMPPAELKYRNPYQASLDGNTVEMPVEQAAFADNNVRYQTSLMFVNSQISELNMAIAGQ